MGVVSYCRIDLTIMAFGSVLDVGYSLTVTQCIEGHVHISRLMEVLKESGVQVQLPMLFLQFTSKSP